MTQDKFTEKISLWLDNELSTEEVSELQHHLTGCPACRQTYEAIRQIDGLLRTVAHTVVAPAPDFPQRVEARLAYHTPAKPWHIGLALAALFGGTLIFVGAWFVLGGIALVGVGTTPLDAGLFHQGITTFIESATSLRVLFNFGALIIKAGLIMMQQPIFWLGTLFAAGVIAMWIRILISLSKRVLPPAQLLV